MTSTPALDELEARVARHPWLSVGGAFALGVWLAVERRVPARRAGRALIAGIARKVVRDLALRQLVALRAAAA